MRLVYSAILAVLIGVVLVLSPLMLAGLSPIDLKARQVHSETMDLQKVGIDNETFSYSADNRTYYEVKNALVTQPQYSLSGVFSAFILGIIVAAVSYFVIKREVIKRIGFANRSLAHFT